MNSAAQSIAAMRVLYGPTLHELAQALPDIGDALAHALAHLARDPTADGIDRASIEVEGVRQHLQHLHAAVLSEHGR